MKLLPLVVTCLALLPPLAAQDAVRAAADIVRDFDRVNMPSVSTGGDADGVRRFREAIQHGCRRKAELAAELQRSYPEHARLPEMLATRWAGLSNALDRADDVLQEVDQLLTQNDLREAVRNEALRARARACIASERCGDVQRLDAISAILDLPGDYSFAAACLTDFVERHVSAPETQRMLYEVAVAKWPGKPYGGRPARRWLAVLDGIDAPFVEQLPEATRPWFAEVTAAPAKWTVVQLWTGLVGDAQSEEIRQLQALREQAGAEIRVIGLLNGDFEQRLPAARLAGVDWPQHEIADPEPMTNPLGMPRFGGCLLLDGELRLVGVLGRAALVKKRIAELGVRAAR
ncbi:MAG: hypothetical protein R3F29_11460 [Planctomycetota bacterium]